MEMFARGVSRRFRAAVWSEPVAGLLDGVGWNDGGCRILADAVARLLADIPHRMVGVEGRAFGGPRIVHHVLIEISLDGRRWYVDGDGVCGRRALLHRWEHTEFVTAPRLVAVTDPDALPIPADADLSARVALALARLTPRFAH